MMNLLNLVLMAAADYIAMAARINGKMEILFQAAEVARKITDVIL